MKIKEIIINDVTVTTLHNVNTLADIQGLIDICDVREENLTITFDNGATLNYFPGLIE